MDLSVRDVARLLAVSEETVYRWVRAGTVPAHRFHEQYRFNRVELQEWAVLHSHRLSLDLFSPSDPATGLHHDRKVEPAAALPMLHAAVVRGGIFYKVPGGQREEVLATVARLPGVPAQVNRELLAELLIGREALDSTGIGGGIALPHPRNPLVVHVEAPVVLLCFLAQPVDFHAPDGQPVRVLLTLLSPSVRVHLQVLAKLALVLHDGALRGLLRTQASAEAIVERIRILEDGDRGAAPGEATPSRSGPAEET